MGDGEALQLLADRGLRARRIGDQHHPARGLAETQKRVDRSRECGDPVMEHTPDVAQKTVVFAGQVLQPRNALHAPASVSARPARLVETDFRTRLPFRRARVNQRGRPLPKMKESSLAMLAVRLYCRYMVAPEGFAR